MKHLKSPPGKRIEGLAPDMPAVEAARKVFDIRLAAVEQMVPLAVARAGESDEFVHQLRVTTRRADSALRTLGSCLEPPRRRRIRRRLGRIRRAAGDARACDVHLGIFRKRRDEAGGDERDVYGELIGWTTRQREAAQREVERAGLRHPPEKLERWRRKVLDAIREPEGVSPAGEPGTLLDVARATLPPLVDAVREGLAADLELLVNLHALRILVKRLRYALEVFAPCYADGLRPAYEKVTALQMELGAINDAYEIIQRVESFAASRARQVRRDAIERVLAGEQARQDDAVRAVLDDVRDGTFGVALDELQRRVAGDRTGTPAPEPLREVGT